MIFSGVMLVFGISTRACPEDLVAVTQGKGPEEQATID
jgi:hypothetical protein